MTTELLTPEWVEMRETKIRSDAYAAGRAKGYAAGVKAAAKVAETYKPPQPKNKSYVFASEELEQAIDNERRGEMIAAEVITKNIRALLTPPDSP